MAQTETIVIDVARVFLPLLEPARYKGAWGGRGSGKSHFFAGLVVDDSQYHKGLRTVCVREVQKTLRESAKRLIENKLIQYGLGESDGFKVYNDVIKTPGDGLIIFEGLQDATAESIKSLEDFHRAWIEEAQTMTNRSLTYLRNTIRADDSEIWASWNPTRKQAAIEKLLRGSDIPTGAVVVNANWSDNPLFPTVLEQERQDCLRLTPDEYDHIWDGGYATIREGAYFAKLLIEAKNGNRIGHVEPDPLMETRAYWDIGSTGRASDAVAVWIAQFIGSEIRVLNYYEAQGQPLAAHVAWLRSQGLDKIHCVLPHDGVTHDKVYDVTYESALTDAGFECTVVKNQGKGAAQARIEAARRLLPSCRFDKDKTEAGREALGWYHEIRDDARNTGLGPNHDWSSNGADAFGLMCIVFEPETLKHMPPPRRRGGWGA